MTARRKTKELVFRPANFYLLADELGMRTVWVTRYLPAKAARPQYVNVKVKSVRQLPKQLHQLR